MRLFEYCPFCSQVWQQEIERAKPMVLSGDDKEMQCDVCNRGWKLHQSEALLELARQQRHKK